MPTPLHNSKSALPAKTTAQLLKALHIPHRPLKHTGDKQAHCAACCGRMEDHCALSCPFLLHPSPTPHQLLNPTRKTEDAPRGLLRQDGGPLRLELAVLALPRAQQRRTLGCARVHGVQPKHELPGLAPHVRLASAAEQALPQRALVHDAACANMWDARRAMLGALGAVLARTLTLTSNPKP